MSPARHTALLLCALALAGCPGGARQAPAGEVVVYCALDRMFSQPVLEAFEAETGIRVLAKWDTEATKTTGLVQAIRAEAGAPRCDVFWNNEVSQTIALAGEGLLEPYASPAAEGLPAWALAPDRTWTGFAARARVLLVNTERVPAERRPTSIRALLDPAWRGQAGIAKPLFGTTATHVAALFAQLGAEEATALLDGMKANGVVICASNADIKNRVAQGELAFGLTDTDDANLALLDGAPVEIVFPDQEEGGLGTLLIPNAVAIVEGGPNGEAARQLVDWLLRPAIEERLAASRSVQVPLRAGLARAAWIPPEIRTPDVAWPDVAAAFPAAREYVERRFLAE